MAAEPSERRSREIPKRDFKAAPSHSPGDFAARIYSPLSKFYFAHEQSRQLSRLIPKRKMHVTIKLNASLGPCQLKDYVKGVLPLFCIKLCSYGKCSYIAKRKISSELSKGEKTIPDHLKQLAQLFKLQSTSILTIRNRFIKFPYLHQHDICISMIGTR